MNIFMIISLGRALFVFCKVISGSGLEKLSGGQDGRTLEKLTKKVL